VRKWVRDKSLIVELFIVVNLGFLALDIFVAHSFNDFSHDAEWIPFYFSLFSPPLLLFELKQNWGKAQNSHSFIGIVMGVCSIVVGVTGMLYHLKDSFFIELTIKSLVYTAPFVAPLAYTGLGCLILMMRMVKHNTAEWHQWLVLFGLGGFLGNFILSLCDHAQNGFFHYSEWLPVISSAFAMSFLTISLVRKCSYRFMDLCLIVMGVQVLIGLLGLYYHGLAILRGPSPHLFENIIFSAPVFAPLLFVNLAALAGFGLWGLRTSLFQQTK